MYVIYAHMTLNLRALVTRVTELGNQKRRFLNTLQVRSMSLYFRTVDIEKELIEMSKSIPKVNDELEPL
jgi:hypothetical protein